MGTIKNIFRHDCTLSREEKGDIIRSPYASPIRNLAFWSREATTVERSSESRRYFRSTASLLKEKKRHLLTKDYHNVIHPLSRFMRNRNTFMFFLWLASLVIDPYLGSLYAKVYLDQHRGLMAIDALQWIFAACYTLDFVSRFYTGYVVPKTGEVVLRPGAIVRNYLKTYFVVDFVPLAHTFVGLIFAAHMTSEFQVGLFVVRYLRHARVGTMTSSFDALLRRLRFQELTRRISATILLALLFTHWCTCVVCLIPTIRAIYHVDSNDSWLVQLEDYRYGMLLATHPDLSASDDPNQLLFEFYYGTPRDYLDHAQVILCHLVGAGVGIYRSDDALEMVLFALLLMTGLISWVVFTAYVLQLFGTVNVSESKFEELLVEMGQYMVRNRFPKRLKKRVRKYYDLKFDKKFFSETIILSTLSEHLRMEVLLYSCRTLVANVQIFKGLSRAAVGGMLALLHQEIYLPGDVIMTNDDSTETQKLFFILYGTCAVETLAGAEAMHIEDGSQFGEIALERENRISVLYRVQAIEAVEIYYLEEVDFQYCCRHYPEIQNKLGGVLKVKMEQYRRIMLATETQEGRMDDSIIAELRVGRILHRGIRRDVMS